MLRSKALVLWVVTLISAILIAGCEGTQKNDTPATNLVDMSLTSLAVSGSQAETSSQPATDPVALEMDPAFDPDFAGPYIIKADADVDTVHISAEKALASNTLTIGRVDVLSTGNVIASGETDIRSIGFGDNAFIARVYNNSKKYRLDYSFIVQRTSRNAKLQAAGLAYTLNDSTSSVTLDKTFSSDVFSYAGSVAYDVCTIKLATNTQVSSTTIDVNGLQGTHGGYVELNVAPGENAINVVTTADGGETETYSFTVTRAAGTAEELAADAKLKSLNISGGRLASDFLCGTRSYPVSLNKSATSYFLTVETASDGATMVLNDFSVITNQETNQSEIVYDNPRDIVSGQPIEVVVNRDSDKIGISVTVTSADDVNEAVYWLPITYLNTNRVYVDSAEDLQAALRGATAGDEIILEATIYNGSASVETSGSDDAHFYSAASGTVTDPIYLVGNSALLVGDSTSDKTALMLTGDYWRVSGLYISDAQNGVVLDGASNNVLSELNIAGVGERGVIMRNGSHSNQLLNSKIATTGQSSRESNIERLAEAVVIGSSPDEWTTAPTPGMYDPSNQGNAIRNVTFGDKILAEQIDIKEGVVGTQIQGNLFNAPGAVDMSTAIGSIAIKGNDTNVSFNSFYFASRSDATQLITVADSSATLVEPWGVGSAIYQNYAELSSPDVTFVNNVSGGETSVADNTTEDGEPAIYLGDVDSTFTTPVYKLQVGDAWCVGVEELSLSEALVLQPCADSALMQSWKIVNGGDGFVQLQLVDTVNVDKVWAALPATLRFTALSSTNASPILISTPFDSALDDGYFSRWQMSYSNDGKVTFINRASRHIPYSLAVKKDVDGEFAEDMEVVISVSAVFGTDAQRFTLVPQ